MECKFTVGQKVVCVEANEHAFDTWTADYQPWDSDAFLTKGEIYTISGFSEVSHPALVEIRVTLFERRNWWIEMDVGFRPDRFRPIQDTKKETSIEGFKDILRKVSEPEKV